MTQYVMSARDAGPIWIAGHEGVVDRSDGVAEVAAEYLGAPVRLVDLWGQPVDGKSPPNDGRAARLLIVEVLDRPDLLGPALKALRRAPLLAEAPVLAAIGPRAINQLDPAAGHADFVVWPAQPSELYARIRQLEWQTSAYASEEHIKLGPLVIDIAAREVTIVGAEGGRSITLTSREFNLLVALVSRRGRVLSRETLLDVVWGADYDGGSKTVDVHVRRLRAKLGEALPLQTIRGAGYVLR
ncbi:MAG: response regulator transcription factor [Deltaproteobacteria bacterium]|nr:response regulator transcription factor [Deltaproteobacteria bacterium]